MSLHSITSNYPVWFKCVPESLELQRQYLTEYFGGHTADHGGPWSQGASSNRTDHEEGPKLHQFPESAHIQWLMSQVHKGRAHSFNSKRTSQIHSWGLHWDYSAGQLFPVSNSAIISSSGIAPKAFSDRLSTHTSDSEYFSREANLRCQGWVKRGEANTGFLTWIIGQLLVNETSSSVTDGGRTDLGTR